MLPRITASLLLIALTGQASPAQNPTITGADQGYKLAYDAFCANDHVQLNNVMSLNRMGQISDEAFVTPASPPSNPVLA